MKDVIIQLDKHPSIVGQNKTIVQCQLDQCIAKKYYWFGRITNIYWFIEGIFWAGFLQNWWPFNQRTHNTTSHFAMPFVSSWSGC